ncbi:MAG TPA: hypothetical protein VGH22_13930 [Candidatus Binatia bacterium]|jgi:hypothetical protein
MDPSLNEAPGFVYVKNSATAFVLNKHGEPIVFTEDQTEMNWLFDWILGYERHHLRALPHFLQSYRQWGELGRLKKSKTQRITAVSNPSEIQKEPVTVRRKFDRRPSHTKGGARRQLIGEQLGRTRILQLRVFQTQQEAEKWAGERDGRRFRFATIGSVGWRRALDEEMKVVQHAQCALLSSNEQL